MAREENVDSARLLRSFERRFLATRGLRSFPWQVGGRARGGLAGAAGDGRGLGYQIRPLCHATASTPLVPRQDLRSWSPGCAKDREDWQWGADVHLRVLRRPTLHPAISSLFWPLTALGCLESRELKECRVSSQLPFHSSF